MTIKKFLGRTEEEARLKAQQELGSSCVVLNVRTVKPTGMLAFLKSSQYEVTAAVEEKENKMPDTSRMDKPTGKINFVADEAIDLKYDAVNSHQQSVTYPRPEVKSSVVMPQGVPVTQPKAGLVKEDDKAFEERLENLQNLLEKSLAPKVQEVKEEVQEAEIQSKKSDETIKYTKMIYNTLLDNEVTERCINQLLDEVERPGRGAQSLDLLLSSVYQKMILKFGQPSPIDLTGKKPKIIFFIGPTGVGKTTTIAKIASKLKMESGKKIALLTADTYRIAAEEQLRTYANILDTSLTIIYSADELNPAIAKVKDSDVILVDTAGFSHKSVQQKEDTKKLIEALDSKYESEIYLVLSATTKYRDLIEIVNSYREIADYKLIFTKLDETTSYGNLYNVKMYTGAELSYVTNGQNVPDDIEVFDTQRIVKKLLGGN